MHPIGYISHTLDCQWRFDKEKVLSAVMAPNVSPPALTLIGDTCQMICWIDFNRSAPELLKPHTRCDHMGPSTAHTQPTTKACRNHSTDG